MTKPKTHTASEIIRKALRRYLDVAELTLPRRTA